MFEKILIANRGEIACRVIKTAKRLGIQTVAVYSAADQFALHTRLADEAYYIGAAPSQQSYLDGEKILAVARQAQVNAIHPGYGFLSENVEFARLCAEAHITFIGPSAESIQAMGSKSTAKAIMEQAGIPLLPGYHGGDQDERLLLEHAEKIGYPVMLKAAAGGGGKGMRVVWKTKDFTDALMSAKREAKKSFNDDTMLIEKYLAKPRHIEMQIFADAHGNTVHLFERDCSIQRRHQKIIEEAPAPHIPDAIKTQMAQAAIAAAKAIHYLGAGTIEFLLDENQQFYFMEMNTRLQVEHPVTEMITGLDLVEWQLRVAAGEPLPLTQEQIQAKGHAIEVRIYAEDTDNQFLPATGRIAYLQHPQADGQARIDTGIQQGSVITPYYDPMIAKLIVWGEDRGIAVQKMRQALKQYHLAGVKTNIEFLQKAIHAEDFQTANISTLFIQKNEDWLFHKNPRMPDSIPALACLYLLLRQNSNSNPSDPFSPWNLADGWCLNLHCKQFLHFHQGSEDIHCTVTFCREAYQIQIGDTLLQCQASLQGQRINAFINEQRLEGDIVQLGDTLHVFAQGRHFQLQLYNPLYTEENVTDISQNICAPMPGTLVAIMAQPGRKVSRGDKLVILEAMKMEHTLLAPADLSIKAIHFQAGDMVEEGAILVSFETGEETPE